MQFRYLALAALVAVAFATEEKTDSTEEAPQKEKHRQYIRRPILAAPAVPVPVARPAIVAAPAIPLASPAVAVARPVLAAPAVPVARPVFAAPAVPVAAPVPVARPVFAAPAVPVAAPLPVVAAQPPAVVAPVGQCPGGPSLPIECDPKRPWPQCPPQSYCYATNSVDIGPYFCCPIWSTYGAAWRPATPFYNYVPPVPANWPEAMRVAASWPAAAVGLPVKARKQQEKEVDGEETEKKDGIASSINGWMERQRV